MSATQADSGGMGYLESRMRRIVTLYLPIAAFLVVLLFPFYWMAITFSYFGLQRRAWQQGGADK